MKEVLKYLRQTNNLTQEEISKKIGISRQSYNKYEKGILEPPMETIRKLAKIFNVDESFIIKNEIPNYRDTVEIQPKKKVTYNIDESLGVINVAEPDYLAMFSLKDGKAVDMKNNVYDAYFDGTAVRVLDDIEFKKGQKFKLVKIEDSEEEKQARREKAWETIMSIAGSLPETFDEEKARNEAMEEKYGKF